jgi:WD40 repeat protein
LSDNNKLMVGFGGHTASVLAVYGFNETSFVTCGKDHAVCLWTIGDAKVRLVAKGTGHSSFVGAVAASPRHIFSASKDGILKVIDRLALIISEAEEGLRHWNDNSALEVYTINFFKLTCFVIVDLLCHSSSVHVVLLGG